jgi:hypothetical protein
MPQARLEHVAELRVHTEVRHRPVDVVGLGMWEGEKLEGKDRGEREEAGVDGAPMPKI